MLTISLLPPATRQAALSPERPQTSLHLLLPPHPRSELEIKNQSSGLAWSACLLPLCVSEHCLSQSQCLTDFDNLSC